MAKSTTPVAILSQAISVIMHLRKAIPFAIENKLWSGFFKHKWMAVFSVLVSIIFSYALITEFSQSIFSDAPAATAQSALDLGEVSDDLKEEGRQSFFSGGMKFLLLILFEVIIFYFSIKTLASLRGKEIAFTMSDFIRAEKRMIKVMWMNYIYALLLHIAVVVVLSIAGLKFLKPVLLFVVYAYFLGYAFLDNYFEQQGLTVKESREAIGQHLGAAIALGAIASALLHVPIIGPMITPIIFAITATLYCAAHEVDPIVFEQA